MRTLIWHKEGAVGPGTDIGEAYRLDGSYNPVRLWVRLKTAVGGANALILDVNVDGTSIFALRPTMLKGATEIEEDAFASVQFSKDSVVTLDVDQIGDTSGMTVGLELDEA